MSDKPFQANDPAQVKKRQDSAKFRKEQQDIDLSELLAMPQFRRYIWRHIHETCGLMRSPFSPNGSTQTLNIGMQDVARAMWAEIDQLKPEAIVTMMQEHAEGAK